MASFASPTVNGCLQIGLTGSIGMGKSTIAKQFVELGFPVFDADATVHKLYSAGGRAVEVLREHFPAAIVDGAVSRPLLAQQVLGNAEALILLESLVHPLVQEEREAFYRSKNEQGEFLVVHDIPLLFENPKKHSFDYVLVATAHADIQRERVLQRAGMSVEKFESILSKQMPDNEKQSRADFLIHTDAPTYAPSKAQVAKIIEAIIQAQPARWLAWKSRSVIVSSSSSGSSSSSSSVASLRAAFDAVVFDLDDTLVPTMGPIMLASQALEGFVAQRMPLTMEACEGAFLAKLRAQMQRIGNEQPLLAHDLTEVRKQALREVARLGGETELALVDEAMEVFMKIRSDITPHLYDDVSPCLDWLLDHGFQVGLLTNGNANLSEYAMSNGRKCFVSNACLGAAQVGALKPSPVPFIAIAQRLRLPPQRILFIGDSYEKDVLGAQNAGMCGALINRSGTSLQVGSDDPPFPELLSLHPSEFQQKIRAFVAEKAAMI